MLVGHSEVEGCPAQHVGTVHVEVPILEEQEAECLHVSVLRRLEQLLVPQSRLEDTQEGTVSWVIHWSYTSQLNDDGDNNDEHDGNDGSNDDDFEVPPSP